MKLIFIFLLLGHLSIGQETLKAEPLDFGFPEKPEVYFSIQQKYGTDTTQWPIYLREKLSLSDMVIEIIDHNSLMINDTIPLMLNKNIDYTSRKADSLSRTYYQVLYDQGNFTFAQIDSTVEFYSVRLPVTDNKLKLTARKEDKIISLSSLEVVKKELPLSYDWRDATHNWITHSFYEHNDIPHLTLVRVQLSSHLDSLFLLYWDDELVYARQEHYQ